MIISAIAYLVYSFVFIPWIICWLLFIIVSKIRSSKIYFILSFAMVVIFMALAVTPLYIFGIFD